jgi:hypothetical protein
MIKEPRQFWKIIWPSLCIAILVSCEPKNKSGLHESSDAEGAQKIIEEVLKADDIRLDKGLNYADTRETSKYFDSLLVRLLLEEEKCKERTKEICNLEANPVYSAQDFSQDGIQVQIENESMAPRMVFNVHIQNGGMQTLKYFLHRENGKWRIEDIQYPGSATLKMWLKQNTGDKEKRE